MRHVCYGLMRLGGTIGFGAAGLAIFKTAPLIGVSLPIGRSLWELSRHEILVVVIAFGIGLAGLVVGQLVGASIKVTSDEASTFIDGVWHFAANSVILWFLIPGTVLGLVMGKEAVQQVSRGASFWELAKLGVVVPAGAGALCAASSWFAVQVVPRVAGSVPALVLTVAGPFVLFGVAGVYSAREFGLQPVWGLPLALMPLLLIPLSIPMIRKDDQRRKAT